MAASGDPLEWFNVDTSVADFLRLLHAADCFPRGGLYSGYYAIQAAQRYERFWTAVLKEPAADAAPLPPLDVAYAWLVHRQDPVGYKAALTALGVERRHPASEAQAFGFSVDRADRKAWKAAAGAHEQWPPPAPGSPYDIYREVLARGVPNYAMDLANSMRHFSRLLHTWLRPHFLDSAFLERAWDRFTKFLRLHAAHPQEVLVPAADIALIWHTYLGLSDKYEEMCARVFSELPANKPALWRPDYLTLLPDQIPAAYGKTAALYTAAYGGEPYADPDTAWIGPEVPYPLAAPASPVAAFLGALDDNPKAREQAPAITRATAKLGGTCKAWVTAVVSGAWRFSTQRGGEGRGGSSGAAEGHAGSSEAASAVVAAAGRRGPWGQQLDGEGRGGSSWAARATVAAAERPRAMVPRAGAHSLYLAWLASRRAEHYYEDAPCGRCFWTSSAAVHAKALSTGVAAVVSCAYFLDLPATSKHPYLKAITVRSGLWQPQQPSAGGAPANNGAAAHHQPPQPPPAFSPTDPERTLGPSQAHLLAGVSQLLGSGAGMAAAVFRWSVAPLWSILGAKGGADKAQAYYRVAWALAAATDVGRMQRAYQHRKHNARDDDHVYYYGTTDYYQANTLWYAYGADAYTFDDPRRNSSNGMIAVGGGGNDGGGGGWSGGDGGGGFSSGDGDGGGGGCGGGGGGGGCGGGGGGCGGGGGGGGD
ncbi:hypothetical protein HYH02_008125 [Chlamydomonas schloesseri]|uniref:Uncharacterized protein n=1 Tax=Chlamydomonas schloesseri TaxID=2026947 RepID=A0A835WGY7_9CHLO|nr:hypothetical protein HYH02_008125 [Chlamydomonas schloesseri]|eukprot:KAG2446971.1 hypothetical protein HYH02_008125 [Chlamydomonas schloesseri]